MKNHDFRELVDRDLSGLVWDERKRQQVLFAIREEEKPVKKISAAFVLIAAVICISVTALAAGLVFAGRVENHKLAEDALLQQYGITSEMLGFFSRTSSEEAGAPVVCYTGVNSLSYVLGSYTVRIRDGKAAACWSWDGAASADGFDSPAWGAAQLAELCRTSRETHDLTAYFVQAEKLAALDGVAVGTGVLFGKDTADAIAEKQQTDAKAAESAAKLSAAEMESIAREALEQRYALTEAQSDHLRNEAENNRYLLFGSDKVPCCEFYFALGFEEDGYVGPGTGIYTVIVNAESGTVEDTLYDSALGGNG